MNYVLSLKTGYLLVFTCCCKHRLTIPSNSDKAITDEEGHLFPRNEPVEVCTDTAEKLSNPPYTGQFTIFNKNDGNKKSYSCSTPEAEGVSCC